MKLIFKDCDVIKVSVADGGEGTTLSLIKELNSELITINTLNPLFESISAPYAISKDGTTAIMEMASASCF